MAEQFSHEQFISPFTWRYGSAAMRTLWSEAHKRRLWRRVWVALAEAQADAKLVTPEQAADLRRHMDAVDIDAAHEAEATLRHDLMAEIRVFAAQCDTGGGIIHLGATSADIEDNADVLRLRDSLDLLIRALAELLTLFAGQIERWANTATMAFTHLQPAEPTTIGYRLASYAQDLLADYQELTRLRADLRGKGMKGAVGTAASFAQLLAGSFVTPAALEADMMRRLDLTAYPITGQTYPRKQDGRIAAVLASLSASLYKFAFDVRLLQSPSIGEWSEGFGAGQVGSSAMPFKRNPINAEKIDSLGRLVAHLAGVLLDNAAHSLLERTLDDSANRREVFPVLFLALDEMLITAKRLISGLVIDRAAVSRTLERYGIFAATEPLLMELVKAGADRQQMHEVLRDHSLTAWQRVADGQPNPLLSILTGDPVIRAHLPPERIRQLLTAERYVGDAPKRAEAFAASLREQLRR